MRQPDSVARHANTVVRQVDGVVRQGGASGQTEQALGAALAVCAQQATHAPPGEFTSHGTGTGMQQPTVVPSAVAESSQQSFFLAQDDAGDASVTLAQRTPASGLMV